jgi:hypothetical protein
MALLVNELEMAFVGLLNESLAGLLPGYPGRSPDTKSLPCFICAADGEGEEDPPNSGNFWHVIHVTVKGTAATEPDGADPKPVDVALATAVFDVILGNDQPNAGDVNRAELLASRLNAQGRILTVFPNGIFFGSIGETREDPGVWLDELPLRVYCCGSILPP